VFEDNGETFEALQCAACGNTLIRKVSKTEEPNPWQATGMTGLNGTRLDIGTPEPSTVALAGLGLAGMMVFRRRKAVLRWPWPQLDRSRRHHKKRRFVLQRVADHSYRDCCALAG
jgi:hypothetical protein